MTTQQSNSMNAQTLPAIESGLSAQIVEPLTIATAQAFAPIIVRPDERLLVDLRADDSTFELELTGVQSSPSSVDTEGIWTPNGRIYRSARVTSPEAFEFMDRIPELGKNTRTTKHVYTAGATDYTALLIRDCWPANQVIYKSTQARQFVDMLVMRFSMHSRRARLAANFKLNHIVPVMPKAFVDHPELPLSDYQRAAVAFAYGCESTALFMDRGTGKTASAIGIMCTSAREMMAKSKMQRTLIISPNQVRTNWANEIRRFCTLPGRTTIIRGGKIERIRLLTLGIASAPDCAFSSVIMGYETATIMIEQLVRIPWDLVILDESHFIKSSATQRYKALVGLRECSRQRLALTGTPIGNSPMDLWSQFEWMGAGLSGFVSFKNFRAHHGVWEKSHDEFGVDKLIGIKNVPVLKERLARISFAVTKKEAGLNLPDKVYSMCEAEMTDLQAEWYKRIAEELVLEIESKLDGHPPDSVTATNILTSLLRLTQVTSGFIVTDAIIDSSTGAVVKPRQKKRIPGPNPKIDELMLLLLDEDRDPNAKSVVWCNFVEDIQHICEELTARGVVHGDYYGGTSEKDRENHVWRFNNDPAFKTLVCNPQTAGEGLNLLGYNPEKPDMTTYCDMEVYFSQNWSGISRSQSEDRAHRRGTRMPVQIIDLMVPGTVDEEIRKRVQGKLAMADLTLDIREILTNVLNLNF